MPKLPIFIALLGFIAAPGAGAEDVVVAEFSADRGLPTRDAETSLGRDSDLYRPDNLYSEELAGSRERSWTLGSYTLAGVMDWGYRRMYWAGEHYGDEQHFTVGSKVLFGDNSETYVYHGFGRDRLGHASEYYSGLGDASTTRTGLAQTLYLADQQAQIGVGYEFATGDREQLYQDLQGHEINVTGRVRIGWGFSAHLEAAYGLYSYSEYDGVQGDLTSARKNMRAGISRSLAPGLKWGMHYSYVDEEFGLSDLSQSRQTWGLNLEYRY